MRLSRHVDLRRTASARAFTLIELIVVLALLAISAALIAPNLGSFMRGRTLNLEARRLLDLTHYGRSRAIAEGVPVLLWLDPQKSTYGLSVQPGFSDGDDDRAQTFTLDSTLKLEIPSNPAQPVSENGDETLGVPDGLSVIRFDPDGVIDPVSVQKIILRQGTEAALQLSPTDNRLAYEILPAKTNE